MAMVDQRAVLLAARRKFLTTSDLPTDIQYDGVRFPDGPPSDKLFINERLRPLEQFQAAFRVSQSEGIVTYEVVAPANRPDLVKEAYDVAHRILENFEHATYYTDTDGTKFQVIRSYLNSTGYGQGQESDFYFVPVVVLWRSFSLLA